MPRHHTIITGTGRAGTTFLVQLLTELGIDTGFPNSHAQIFAHANAGMEFDLRDPKAPYIVKSPWLCDYLDEVLQTGEVIVDYAIVPMRDLYSAAQSRRLVTSQADPERANVPGGLWHTKEPEDQETVLTMELYKLFYAIAKHNVPLVLLFFPRFVTDPEYLYQEIKFLLEDISYDRFLRAFQLISQPKLVHEFHAPKQTTEVLEKLESPTPRPSNVVNPLDYPIAFEMPRRIAPSTWLTHTPFAMFLVDLLRPRTIVELGTHHGVSYCAFCQAVSTLGLETRCYAIDTWRGDPQAGFYGDEVLIELRKHHDPLYADFSSLVQSTFDEALVSFPDGTIDLLHIDGFHTYEAVRHDFENWLPKLSQRGVILLHDTNVREGDFGVWRLWEELKSKHPHFDFFHGYGLGLLAVGEKYPASLDLLLVSEAQPPIREFFSQLGIRVEKEHSIQMLTTKLANKETQLAQIETQLMHKEDALQRLGSQLQDEERRRHELAAQIVNKKRELDEIHRSKAWRLILVLRRMRLWLVPLGSRRERVLRWALQSFRTLRAGNVRLLLHRTLNTLRDRRTPTTSSTARPVHPPDHDVYVPISEKDVDPSSVSVKVIAFYLPQFHPIPENDEWWGKGFTEWTNVTKARPNFEGHYQPQIPDELGYYDLRLPEVQKRQIELAKKYGIHGFCFYYYWFSGKRLLERPLDQYLANSDLDLPFCLCWANENWTRRWDGAEHEILIAQSYNEQEYVHFIRDISPNFLDPRYIRVDGKPILLVYRINLLPDPQEAAEIWRAECRKLGIGEIYLVAVQSFGIGDPRPFGFDAAVEFPPSNLGAAAIRSDSVRMTNPNFKGKILDYNLAAQIMMEKPHEGYTAFKAVMPSWDNTARRQNDSHIFINSSSSAYKNWLARAVTYTTKYLPEDRRFVFVNAWNEWAEGTHLEPDKLRGYAYLQATAEAITRGKFRSTLTPAWTILFVSHDANNGGAQRVLLNTIAWLKAHTKISIKILCLAGGDLLPQFQALGDTLVFTDLKQGEADLPEEEWADRLLAALHYESPDLIYGNTVVAGKAYPWLAQLRAPILTHVHEMDSSIKFYAANTMEHVLKYSSHFLSSSKAVRENLIRNYSVPEEKVSIGHASIYPDAQRTILDKMEKNRLRKKLGLAQDKFVIFGCGIGMPFRKGADLFIELARILRRKGYDGFHLYWIGGFEKHARDDRYGVWSDYLRRLEQSEVRNDVTFLGYKKDPREYFQVGDVHVMTSREEPFGLVALEAADCGIPTICFENAGAADFVEEDAGYTVPLEDMEAMAQKVIHLMENEDHRAALGTRAKEKFLDAFTIERTTPHILSACRMVARQKPGVSIIVPNYNHAPYLPQRLESIFNQTYQDFEIILLDDCSSDNSLEILDRYAGRADVQIIRSDQNSGSPFRQWLKGLDLAKGDIWWIAESDDVSDPRFLESLLPAFDHPHVKLAYANSHIIDEKGAVVGDYLGSDYLTALSRTKWNTSYRLPAEQEINEALGIKDTILNVSAVLFLRFTIDPLVRSTLNKMRSSGDWYFIVQAIKGGEVYYEARKLNYHRRHSESVIGKMVNSKIVDTFYKEMSIVHRAVAENYNLSASFYEKWDQYLHDQWTKFFQDRPFDDLNLYYPIDEHRSTISRRIPEKR